MFNLTFINTLIKSSYYVYIYLVLRFCFVILLHILLYQNLLHTEVKSKAQQLLVSVIIMHN